MILHICCNLAGSTVFPQLFTALRDIGLPQTVFVPEKRRADMGRNHPEGVPTLQRLTVRRSDALFFFRKAQRSVKAIRSEINLTDVKLIHAHTLFTDGSIAAKLSRETGIPYGVTLRYSDTEVIWPKEPHLRGLGRRVLREASFVVFLSEKGKEKVLGGWVSAEERTALEKKCVVIPNGIQPEWLDGTARSAPGNPLRVGFAGRLNGRKRPLDSLEAAHAANDALSCVWIGCGAGPLEERVRAGMAAGDEWRGALSGMTEMKRFYRDIDVLLVPSQAETVGMVYLEAMSQGVPVLYTKGQGFDGQLPEGQAGFAVPCGDVPAMKDAILRIAEDYAGFSERSVRAAQRFSWPLIAERWRACYSLWL